MDVLNRMPGSYSTWPQVQRDHLQVQLEPLVILGGQSVEQSVVMLTGRHRAGLRRRGRFLRSRRRRARHRISVVEQLR